MNFKYIIGITLLTQSFNLMADQSYYCPQNHQFINLGMTQDQVIAACGQPISQQESNKPIVQKIPVQQLMYNANETVGKFYTLWGMSNGVASANLEVDVVDNKVKAIKVNSGDSNATSLCDNVNIQVDDPVGKVYSACGVPTTVNNTFVNQIVPSATKPMIWIYQPGQFEAPISLTFVDGKLQSINN